MTYSEDLIERTIALHKEKYNEEISHTDAKELLKLLANIVREIAPAELVRRHE